MKKKILCAVTAIMCLIGLAPLNSNAETYSDEMQYGDCLYYKQIDKDEDGIYDYIEISGCDESAKTADIPDEIDGLPVKIIGEWAFYNRAYLTDVTIPKGVTAIGDYAFSDCVYLSGAVIPDSVTRIGDYAFAGCVNLKGIKISNGIVSIGDYAFSGCRSLKSMTIPDSVTTVGDFAFLECCLTSIMIPNSVTSIETNTFSGCYNLTAINVSEDNACYSSVDGVLFNKDRTRLIKYPVGKEDSEYTIPDSVTNIGNRAFRDCSVLTDVTIPHSVTTIGEEAFSFCYALTSVTIPDTVTSISDGTFFYCTSLTSVTVPNSVTSIGGNAFSRCKALESITLFEGVVSIGSKAFSDCDDLKSVIIENPQCEIYNERNTILNGYDDEASRYYYNGVIRGYENSTAQKYAENWGYAFEAIGEGHWKASDLVELQKYIVKSVTVISKRFDLNSDGIINVFDAALLRRKLLYG
ncbi:MAG: leucine-rich repeat protein [Clostridium sp.]|nr:leucine-rich repeat protein [Clostridium sp.]MCM1547264.1 leucine-rich repeat protein [Ruminococcus sp.]